VTLGDLRRYAGVPVDCADERYREPLLRDLRALLPRLDGADVVLLGSMPRARTWTSRPTRSDSASSLPPTSWAAAT
jgi:hypothetical protein